MNVYLPYGASQESLNTHAYLLLIVHAFHCPTPFQLYETTSEAIVKIAERLLKFQIAQTLLPFELDDVDDSILAQDRKGMVLLKYCYTAYEIIVSLWSCSFEALICSLDDKVCSLVCCIAPRVTDNNF